MKLLFDLFPVIAFFISLKLAEKFPAVADFSQQSLHTLGMHGPIDAELLPIMLATMVVIVASLIQIVYVKWRHGKVETMLWVSAALVVLMGALTLYLQNPNFIKWKPTLLYWLFAVLLFGAQWLYQKNLIKSMMGKEIDLPQARWNQLNWAWIGFFIAMGGLNLYIAYHYSTSTWASFKLFGSFGLTLLFVIVQAWWMQSFIQEK